MRPTVGSALVVAAIVRSASWTTKTLPSAVATSSWLRAPPPPRTSPAESSSSLAFRASSAPRVSSPSVDASTAPSGPKTTALRTCEEISIRSVRASAAPIDPTLTQAILRSVRIRKRRLVQKFFEDRGTHLAAMIAYFALLSFVPLTFLALALLGLSGRADESSFLVTEIKHALPRAPVPQIVQLVRAVQRNAATLGIIGGAARLWTALSLLRVLEPAVHIV